MSKLICLIIFLVFAASMPAYSKDKDSSLGKAIEDVFRDDNHPGKGKAHPGNPGKHGRDNADDKQSRGHGNGSKKEDSWEDRIRDELKDDDKGKNKKKNKNKKN